MFCPKCKTEYREGFFECTDCNIKLVEELPFNDEFTVDKVKSNRVKKRPIIGITTIVLSLPVIIWISISIFGKKNYPPDIYGAFLFIFQGVGIIGGVLIYLGRIYGYYVTICTWIFYCCFEIIRWYQWLFDYYSSLILEQTIPYFRLFSSLVFIPLGFSFVYILFKDLRGKQNKANSTDAKNRADV